MRTSVVNRRSWREGVDTSGGLDRVIGGAFGEGIEANIRALYRLIVHSSAEGDRRH